MNFDNPILNSPYAEPRWHYATDTAGNLNYEDIRPERRIFDPKIGGYSMPVQKQTQGSIFEVNDYQEEYGTHLINLLRKEVGNWRNLGYPDTTGTTRDLLQFWFLNPERHPTRRLFFAQREAIETAVWLNEVAQRSNAGNNILNKIREANTAAENGTLNRICFKMATGTGKTVVMAALILYHYLNRQQYRQDTRFCDYFLLVAPGITIKDRLGVLFVDNSTGNKNDAKDYYRERDLVPQKFERLLEGLNARLVITNYHAFEPKTLQGNKRSVFDGKIGRDGKKQEAKEEMAQVLRRLMPNFKPGGRLLVLNDEAHHCYLPKEKGRNTDEENTADENERAAVWYTGVAEVAKRWQVRTVYDLSATPYYLSGSGYPAYTLFPWIVSEFGLVDAIESGLVKIPFLPELDNTQELLPVLRDLYSHVKEQLPKKGAKTQRKEAAKEGLVITEAPPNLPVVVKTAIDQFYNHYAEYNKGAREAAERRGDLFTAPPVLIAVCNNTNVSKELYKYIAGYEYQNAQGDTIIIPGKCAEFSNYEQEYGQWRAKRKPPTLLIDSDALENSNQVNDDFKKIFASEIEQFKREYRQRHPDKSVENLSDADILREVVNTVGKPGTVGNHIRCVVSVSMLTEGWDVNTVTHIMGLRAFGSQLLCEQVAGRALRRKQYVPTLYHETVEGGKPVWKAVAAKDEHKYKPENLVLKFSPEYAHIIGVPFKMFKGGQGGDPPPLPDSITVKALPERQAEHEIIFPNLIGYRADISGERIEADFSGLQNFEVDLSKIPVRTVMSSAFMGERDNMEVRDVLDCREQEITYGIARQLVNLYFRDPEDGVQWHLFPQLQRICAQWYREKVTAVGDRDAQSTYKKLVACMDAKAYCDHIYQGVRAGRRQRGEERILPVFNHYNPFGSTKYIHGLTTKPCYATHKSHVNYVVADAASTREDANYWEHIAAKTLEELPEIQSYVKNAYCDFQIPYTAEGKERHYKPDFLARCPLPNGETLMLILEITGANKQYKAEKKFYTEQYWIPAVEAVAEAYPQLRGVRWRFLEVSGEMKGVKEQIINKLTLTIKQN